MLKKSYHQALREEPTTKAHCQECSLKVPLFSEEQEDFQIVKCNGC